jgi:hypothetical protein
MTISKALSHLSSCFTRIITLSTITLLLNGCLYTKIRVPLDDDVWETKLGSRVGVASTHSVLWLFAWGEAGTKDAAENGNIKVVHHMDLGITSYLAGLYTRRDTIVYGD